MTTQGEASAGLRDLIVDVVADMAEAGETVPEPLSTRHYSDNLNLRLGESHTTMWP